MSFTIYCDGKPSNQNTISLIPSIIIYAFTVASERERERERGERGEREEREERERERVCMYEVSPQK